MGKKARLWEDTLVIALRDAQWIRALEHGAAGDKEGVRRKIEPPPGFLKADGRAESRMGDVQLAAGEKFFIFEVKPTEDQISAEWRKGRKFKAKMAYERLSELVAQYLNKKAARVSFETELDLIRLSLRGHYLAFWSDTDIAPGVALGRIRVDPYVTGVVRMNPSPNKLWTTVMRSLDFQVQMHRALSRESSLDLPTLENLFASSKMGAFTFDDTYGPVGVGLDEKEMQRYVNFLCDEANGKGQPIHAVVLATKGSFFRIATTTKDLVKLLTGTLYADYSAKHNAQFARDDVAEDFESADSSPSGSDRQI